MRALLLAAVLAGGTAVLYFTQLSGLEACRRRPPRLVAVRGPRDLGCMRPTGRHPQPAVQPFDPVDRDTGAGRHRLLGALAPPDAITFGHLAASARRRMQPLKALANWLAYTAQRGHGGRVLPLGHRDVDSDQRPGLGRDYGRR